MPFTDNIYNKGLLQIESKFLELNEKSVIDVKLTRSYNNNEFSVFVNDSSLKLVIDQRQVYDANIESVINNSCKILFLDFSRATGKNFLTNLVLKK